MALAQPFPSFLPGISQSGYCYYYSVRTPLCTSLRWLPARQSAPSAPPCHLQAEVSEQSPLGLSVTTCTAGQVRWKITFCLVALQSQKKPPPPFPSPPPPLRWVKKMKWKREQHHSSSSSFRWVLSFQRLSAGVCSVCEHNNQGTIISHCVKAPCLGQQWDNSMCDTDVVLSGEIMLTIQLSGLDFSFLLSFCWYIL